MSFSYVEMMIERGYGWGLPIVCEQRPGASWSCRDLRPERS